MIPIFHNKSLKKFYKSGTCAPFRYAMTRSGRVIILNDLDYGFLFGANNSRRFQSIFGKTDKCFGDVLFIAEELIKELRPEGPGWCLIGNNYLTELGPGLKFTVRI